MHLICFSLNWPVIIAGSQMFGNERSRVLDIFEVFRYVEIGLLGIMYIDCSSQNTMYGLHIITLCYDSLSPHRLL